LLSSFKPQFSFSACFPSSSIMLRRNAVLGFIGAVTVLAIVAVVLIQPAPSASVIEKAAGATDFTCEIPDVNLIITAAGSADFSKPLPACAPFAAFSADTQFTYLNIANSWKASGMNMNHCAAAVIIAAGECQPPTVGIGMCDLKATGASGLFQTDWVLTAPVTDVGPDAATRVLNPCENARYGYGNIVKPPDSYDKACYTGDGGSVQPPLTIDCASKDTCPTGGGVGGCDWDYSLGHCNWCLPRSATPRRTRPRPRVRAMPTSSPGLHLARAPAGCPTGSAPSATGR
jgi:hypothetical protein